MEMKALYPVSLPTERDEADDKKDHEDWIKKNESCLNMNFSAIADKLFELETRLALLESEE
ncbi:MAG: hypothetical protein K6G56_07440 [Clostridiales bacterium]|nr:hypothetical protein [Clostridiales bacterium]